MSALLAGLACVLSLLAVPFDLADAYTCRDMARPERTETLQVPIGDPAPRCPRRWLVEYDGPVLLTPGAR
jgi:hypothetical protein